ncbi:hypothetical protein FA15DRAFT_662008 [Coprinopsis marcescibilis]|uniref:Uncharacterized protein n=1 Tax=Coprinopsis marcescibilis TaxID=230819 RepID=A0A5C3K9A1_COPMA|nr:hypothetical protein FA15DRAFT_662008 [Coprinopsis marcescibilis]
MTSPVEIFIGSDLRTCYHRCHKSTSARRRPSGAESLGLWRPAGGGRSREASALHECQSQCSVNPVDTNGEPYPERHIRPEESVKFGCRIFQTCKKPTTRDETVELYKLAWRERYGPDSQPYLTLNGGIPDLALDLRYEVDVWIPWPSILGQQRVVASIAAPPAVVHRRQVQPPLQPGNFSGTTPSTDNTIGSSITSANTISSSGPSTNTSAGTSADTSSTTINARKRAAAPRAPSSVGGHTRDSTPTQAGPSAPHSVPLSPTTMRIPRPRKTYAPSSAGGATRYSPPTQAERSPPRQGSPIPKPPPDSPPRPRFSNHVTYLSNHSIGRDPRPGAPLQLNDRLTLERHPRNYPIKSVVIVSPYWRQERETAIFCDDFPCASVEYILGRLSRENDGWVYPEVEHVLPPPHKITDQYTYFTPVFDEQGNTLRCNAFLGIAVEMVTDKESWDCYIMSWQDYEKAAFEREHKGRASTIRGRGDNRRILLGGGLDDIARAVRTEIPTSIIPPSDTVSGYVREICGGRMKAVVKRDRSACADHVIHCGVEQDTALEIYTSSEDAVDEFFIERPLYFRRPVWFIQPYIDEMRSLGKFLFLFINGCLRHSVETHPRSSKLWKFHTAFTLPQLSEMIPEIIQDWGSRQGPARIDYFLSSNEMQLEALKYLDKLILSEERISKLPSSLRLFCRIDMSIFRRRDNTLGYFVNGVHRAHDTDWFVGSACPTTSYSMVVDTLYTAAVDRFYDSVRPHPPVAVE